ncbi:ATP-binding protein [Kitasatospora cystarginea]|uniref:ATP-binding protein n=1 Tax=Kitasatospora cystarginea TaxID=58350 RepID=A0ABN3DBY7_9ACTN
MTSSPGASAPTEQWTTLEGWRQFVAEEPPLPLPLTRRQWLSLTEDERVIRDDERIDHHTRLVIVATSAVRQAVTCGRRLVLLNRHARSGRRGLMLSGRSSTGKTTAITQLGRSHELLDRRRHPGVHDRIPVVYITVPPAATARMVAAEFARFLGLPVSTRWNMTDIIEAVVGVLTTARTSMVLIDEVHNISLSTRPGAEVSDTLKYFSERIPATFVYAGINAEREGLFSGTRGEQIAGRFTLIPTRAFPYNEEWKRLVARMDSTLRLLDHKPGNLTDLDRYIHDRTKGMIGALSQLVCGAALDAIQSGTEKITKAGLKAVPLDVATDFPNHVNS